jgi:hypothetical protein
VGGFWLTFYPDQILLFSFQWVFSLGFGKLLLGWEDKERPHSHAPFNLREVKE